MNAAPDHTQMVAALREIRTVARDLIDRTKGADPKVMALMMSTDEGRQSIAGVQGILEALHPELTATGREMGKALEAIRKATKARNRWGMRA